MDHEIVDTPEAIELVGIETSASNANPGQIGALWGRVREEDPFAGADPIYAIYHDFEGDHTQPYAFFIGRPIAPDAETPEGLVRRTLAGGRFARFVAEGEQPAAMMQAWMGIWDLPLDRRYEQDYEIHSAANPTRVEIFVGI